METKLILEEIEKMAASTFGKQITNCSHETLDGVVRTEMSQDKGEMNSITVGLTRGNTAYLLHALRELEIKYQHIVNGNQCDEADRSFYAYDLQQIKWIHDKIRTMAVSTFGPDILCFSHETL